MVPGHFPHCLQHPLIANPPFYKLLVNHANPLTAEILVAFPFLASVVHMSAHCRCMHLMRVHAKAAHCGNMHQAPET
jgi:hypothetical protein